MEDNKPIERNEVINYLETSKEVAEIADIVLKYAVAAIGEILKKLSE